MDKDILKQYIDACEAVKETEEQIRQLQKNRKTVVVDAVKGSMHDFPFAAKSFKVAGIAHSVLEDPGQLDREQLIQASADEWIREFCYYAGYVEENEHVL